MPKIRNILIFVAIAAALVLVYIFFIQPALSNQNQAGLISSTNTGSPGAPGATATTTEANSSISADFLTLLLNINTIKLDAGIFANPAFSSLHDSTITLIPDSTQGRPNPFAQFGSDSTATSPTTTPATTPTATTPPVIPTTPPTTKTPASTPPKTTTTSKTTTPSTKSTGTNGTTVTP